MSQYMSENHQKLVHVESMSLLSHNTGFATEIARGSVLFDHIILFSVTSLLI